MKRPASVPMAAGTPGPTAAPAACPNCGGGELDPFYELAGVPAHSVRLMHSREEAVAYPRGDLTLAFCQACGFVTNTSFDVSLNEYSPNFEETQHFSPTFTKWAGQLVDRLVRDYDIRGRQIIEIGCGKGDFLALLCEAGDNTGIGIDPGCIPDRLSPEASRRVRFIRDLYSDEYAHLPADVICCRHTLEHIQPTAGFVQMLRRVIGDRPDTLVFLEVPDLTRVLRERAFWDMYYEHCSYFTAGSLARVFRQAGFEILELTRDFGDQYLWLMARPAASATTAALPLEGDLAVTRDEVAAFGRRVPEDIATWRERLRAFSAAGQKPVLWGAGSKAVAIVASCGITSEVEYLVDVNPHKAGKFLPGSGHPVVSPAAMREYQPGVVVAMNPIYVGEIRRQLGELGVNALVTAV